MGTFVSRAMSHIHPIRSLKNVSRKAVTSRWESGYIAEPKHVGQIDREQLDTINDVFEGQSRPPRQLRDRDTNVPLFEADGTTPRMDNPPRLLDRLNEDYFNVGVQLKGNTFRHGKGSAHFRLTVSDEHGRSIKVKKEPNTAFLADSIPATAKDSNGKRTSWIRSRKKSQPEPVYTGLQGRVRAVYTEADALDQAIYQARTHRSLVTPEEGAARLHTGFLSIKFLTKFGSPAYREVVAAFIRNAGALNDLEDTTVRLKSNGVFRIRTELQGKEFKIPFKRNPITKRNFKEWDLKKRSDESWGQFIDRASQQAVQQERTMNNTRRRSIDEDEE